MRRVIAPSEDIHPEWRAAREDACRPFTAEEGDALRAALFDSKPSQPHPALLLMSGPPGAGKSTCRDFICRHLGIDPGHLVQIDSDEMRPFHRGWQRLVALRDADGVGIAFADAQALGSQACAAAKATLAALALEGGKHMTLTSVKKDKWAAAVEQAKAAGYTVHLAVVTAPLAELHARATGRAHEGGRVTTHQTVDTLEALILHVQRLAPTATGSVLVVGNGTPGAGPAVLLAAPAAAAAADPAALDRALRTGFALPPA